MSETVTDLDVVRAVGGTESLILPFTTDVATVLRLVKDWQLSITLSCHLGLYSCALGGKDGYRYNDKEKYDSPAMAISVALVAYFTMVHCTACGGKGGKTDFDEYSDEIWVPCPTCCPDSPIKPVMP
jgi:hypothetical protein